MTIKRWAATLTIALAALEPGWSPPPVPVQKPVLTDEFDRFLVTPATAIGEHVGTIELIFPNSQKITWSLVPPVPGGDRRNYLKEGQLDATEVVEIDADTGQLSLKAHPAEYPAHYYAEVRASNDDGFMEQVLIIIALPEVPRAENALDIFTQRIETPAVTFWATERVDPAKIEYAANVANALLLKDRNGSGVITEQVKQRQAVMTLFYTFEERNTSIGYYMHRRALGIRSQDLEDEEIIPDYLRLGGPEGIRRDASVEEITHLIHRGGIMAAYPEVQERLEAATEAAVERGFYRPQDGLPADSYADEYLAYGLDIFYGARQRRSYNGMPLTPENLRIIDPELFEILSFLFPSREEFFREMGWEADLSGGDSSPRRGRLNAGQDMANVIPMRQRVQIMQGFWDWKVKNLLPVILREQGIDMWIVRNDEQPEYRQTSYREGPIYTSLLPANHEGMVFASQYEDGLEIPEFLMFYDTGDEIEYVQPRDYAHLGELVRARDPQRIAISETNNEPMLNALGEYAERTSSSWSLGVRWLETMGPEQINVYRYVQRVASDIIAEGFSNAVIIPDVTTVEDLNWWFRQKMLDLDIEKENHPTVGIQRTPANIRKYAAEDSPDFFRYGRSDNGMNPTIRRGDIISLDSDIMLLGMVTDSHQHAYVLEEGETDVPEALKEALRIVNRMQDLYAQEFQYGRTGLQIVAATDAIPREDGVISSSLGFHPPPMFLRRFTVNGLMFSRGTWVAGLTSGPRYKLHRVVSNDHTLEYNTLYAFEPHTRVAVPGWGDNGVELGIGQIAVFTEDGLRYLDRVQDGDGWHVIR